MTKRKKRGVALAFFVGGCLAIGGFFIVIRFERQRQPAIPLASLRMPASLPSRVTLLVTPARGFLSEKPMLGLSALDAAEFVASVATADQDPEFTVLRQTLQAQGFGVWERRASAPGKGERTEIGGEALTAGGECHAIFDRSPDGSARLFSLQLRLNAGDFASVVARLEQHVGALARKVRRSDDVVRWEFRNEKAFWIQRKKGENGQDMLVVTTEAMDAPR